MQGEFGPHKGKKVIAIEVGFGSFRKILLMVVQAIMLDFSPGVEKHLFIGA